ncbi:protein YgfX [Chromobacterium sp. CV08]|uniref:protein YgfX n=1 Tax=Chromobacterium sp. CV08 TaxID=3133274 RepID=UPI003DA86A55
MSRDRALLQPFAVPLRPSRAWLALVLAAYAGYAAALLACLPPAYAISLPAAAWFGWRALRADGWWRRDAPDRLEVDPQGRLFLCRGGERQAAEPLDDCFVTPLLTVLNASADGRRLSVMLWPDSSGAESRRLLRAYLLWFHPPQPTDDTETPR